MNTVCSPSSTMGRAFDTDLEKTTWAWARSSKNAILPSKAIAKREKNCSGNINECKNSWQNHKSYGLTITRAMTIVVLKLYLLSL